MSTQSASDIPYCSFYGNDYNNIANRIPRKKQQIADVSNLSLNKPAFIALTLLVLAALGTFGALYGFSVLGRTSLIASMASGGFLVLSIALTYLVVYLKDQMKIEQRQLIIDTQDYTPGELVVYMDETGQVATIMDALTGIGILTLIDYLSKSHSKHDETTLSCIYGYIVQTKNLEFKGEIYQQGSGQDPQNTKWASIKEAVEKKYGLESLAYKFLPEILKKATMPYR